MSEQPDYTLPEEIKESLQVVFSAPKADSAFVDRLSRQLSDQVEQFTTHQRKIQIPVSPLAWGAISIIFIALLAWGIKTLIPRVEPSISTQSSPSPMVSPSPPVEATQAEGAEGVINLPVPAGIPVPWPKEAITSENAHQVTELARWGKGTIGEVAWSADGKSFAVGSSIGIYLYAAETFEETNFLASNSGVSNIAYSPDGTTLASGFYDGTVKIWDVASGNELRTLDGHTQYVTIVAYSPDGKILATTAYYEPTKLWDVASGQELRSINVNNGVRGMAFSPDGDILATTTWDPPGNKKITLWDVASGQQLRTLERQSSGGSEEGGVGVAFSPDGKIMACGYEMGSITLWDATNWNELRTLTGNASGVLRLAFSPDGDILASAGFEGPLKLWDVASGQELRTFGGDIWGVSMAFSPDGKTILASIPGDTAIKLWDVASGQELRTLDWQGTFIYSVAVSPDGNIVASGSNDGSITLWNAANGQEVRTLTGHLDSISDLTFSPNGKMLASGSSDNTIKLWDVASGQVLRTFGENIQGGNIAFSPDGKILAGGGTDGKVKLWEATTGLELRALGGGSDGCFKYGVYSLAFSPDGKIVASGYACELITLWDAASGEQLRTLTGADSGTDYYISSLAFSPGGEILASGSSGMKIKLWDVASWSELRTFGGDTEISSVAFSRDGDVLASGGDMGLIKLWDTASGRELNNLTEPAASLAFSHDGEVLVSGAWNGAVRLWGIAPSNAAQPDVATGAPNLEITFPPEPSPTSTPEALGVEKIPIPALLTGGDLQAGTWSLDGSYFYYSEPGPIDEAGPNQAFNTVSFLNARTGEICPSIQETVNITQTAFGTYPEGIGLFERTVWLDNNRMLYINPSGELIAITPCSDSTENWSASLPDSILSFRSINEDYSQILIKGEHAYWLYTPSTRLSVKLGLPVPEAGKEISFAWSPWEEKLVSSRLEDRQGEMWIIIESIDAATGTASPIYEVQASPGLQGMEPMSAGFEWISKDQLRLWDTMIGEGLIDISSQPVQFTNLYPDLFGMEAPSMNAVSISGSTPGTGGHDYHLFVGTGLVAGGQFYLYHAESGLVDIIPFDQSLILVFPNRDTVTAQLWGAKPSSKDIYRVINVDTTMEPFDLEVKGHTPRPGTWLTEAMLPGAQQDLFSSIQGISLVDLKSGEILHFWGLENQEQYQDFYSMLSPDGKTVLGFALKQDPGEWYKTTAMYWLRLEP
jgi:WD40 repeat protein